MTSAHQALAAYNQVGPEVRSDRSVEYEAISRISRNLRCAELQKNQDYARFTSALSENLRLWSTLAAAVSDKDNALPSELRASLFWLADYVRHETQRILRGSGEVDVLLDVNLAVMQGLRPTEASQ